MNLSAEDLARYNRHLALREIGIEGQEKLKAAKVLVVGAGGLGSPSILYLAAAGVGTLGIVDFDTVDISNLQRQVLFDTADVGSPKADAARARLQALNPSIEVIAHQTELRASNVLEIFSNYDVILDGTDRFATRYLSNDACVLSGKPLVSAAIHRFEGQAFTYVPNRGPCYRCLFAEPPSDGTVPNCAEAGVLGVLPGVMGTIQATEAIKLIVGVGTSLIGRLLTYDALEMHFAEFAFSRRANCAVCGESPIITKPQDPPEFCSVEALTAVKRLMPLQLAKSIATDSQVLIDVREPHEFSAGHLNNAINIPLSQLSDRVAELSKSTSIIFMCRSGGRSLQASGIAVKIGLANVSHLEGGLLAWSKDIDQHLFVAPP